MNSNKIIKHTEHIISATKSWLRAENPQLKKAIEKTVEEGLFSLEDIQFQISVLRENVEAGQIEEWIKGSGLSDEKNAKGKKVLCLHAGNLPLVAFQTALAVLLSGADYYGKISRKDPYLPASFLDEVKKFNPSQKIEYSIDLLHFKGLEADTVVFAGSPASIPAVKNEITRINAAGANADYIIRTAKFSIAYLDDRKSETMQNLVEAMFRYGGKGCRSVAMVVSPFSLDSVKEELISKAKSFLERNPQVEKPKPILKFQHAYNKAIGRSQIWLEDFLIQESDEFPETDFTLNWVLGDEEKVRELRNRFGDAVQSVYAAGNKTGELEAENLTEAQRPPIWWKPDGMDVIEELVKKKSLEDTQKE